MKKRLFALFFILLFTFSLVFAQLPDGFGDNGDGKKVSAGLVQEREGSDRLFWIDNIYEQLLKNDNVAAVDVVFQENSFLFRVLFGVPYEFSGTMFLIVLLWLCVLLPLPDMVDSIDFFNKITSWIAALLIVIILAQAQFFRVIVNVSEKVVFLPENQWIKFILFIILIVFYIFIYHMEKSLGDYFEKARKKREDEDLKENTVAISKNRLKGEEEGESEDLG